MRKISANYIYTGTSSPLRNGIITLDDSGKILNIEDTGGNLREIAKLSFYNGIIVPGFVNAHCHLELSHLKGLIPKQTGLARFILVIYLTPRIVLKLKQNEKFTIILFLRFLVLILIRQMI